MRYSQSVKDDAIRLYLDGHSLREIASTLNIKASSSIHKWLTQNNIKTRPNVHSTEMRNKVFELYQIGLSITQISKKLSVSQPFVNNVLSEHNVKFSCSYNDDVKQKAFKLYETNPNLTDIGRQLQVTPYTINCWLKQENIPIRKHRICRHRQFDVNDDFLKTIDNEEKAYFLGFMVGDGYVNVKKKSFSLCLSVKDIGVLRKIKNIIGATNPIHTYMDRGYEKCLLDIYSESITDDLLKLGIDNTKTFTAKPLKLNDSIQHHFWRSLMDADGSIYFVTQRNCFGFSLCGTFDICTGFSNFLGYNGKYVSQDKTIWQFRRQGNIRTYDNLSRLYKNATVFLDRKYKLYKDLEKCIPSRLPGLEIQLP